MDNDNIIIALCHEAGDQGIDEEILDGWLANHSACCAKLDLTIVADLVAVRGCMGLPILR